MPQGVRVWGHTDRHANRVNSEHVDTEVGPDDGPGGVPPVLDYEMCPTPFGEGNGRSVADYVLSYVDIPKTGHKSSEQATRTHHQCRWARSTLRL